MKAKLLFFLFLIMLLHVSTSAFPMQLKTKQQIVLRAGTSQHSHRSIPILPTAFIDGSLLSIDFPPIVSPITIIVRNAETGEIVCSGTILDANTVMIDLAGKITGKYTLEILFDATTLSGDFFIEVEPMAGS